MQKKITQPVRGILRCNALSGLDMVPEMFRYPGLRSRESKLERFALFVNVKMNFDDPNPSRRDGIPITNIFEIWEREKGPTAPKFVPKGQLKNNFGQGYPGLPSPPGRECRFCGAFVPTNEFAG